MAKLLSEVQVYQAMRAACPHVGDDLTVRKVDLPSWPDVLLWGDCAPAWIELKVIGGTRTTSTRQIPWRPGQLASLMDLSRLPHQSAGVLIVASSGGQAVYCEAPRGTDPWALSWLTFMTQPQRWVRGTAAELRAALALQGSRTPQLDLNAAPVIEVYPFPELAQQVAACMAAIVAMNRL
jgi:hypothetical protein